MTTLMLQYRVADEGVDEVARAVGVVAAQLAEVGPAGVRWGYYRRPGEFVALLELADGAENPFLALAGAPDLQAAVKKWAIGEVPMPERLEFVGGYGVDG